MERMESIYCNNVKEGANGGKIEWIVFAMRKWAWIRRPQTRKYLSVIFIEQMEERSNQRCEWRILIVIMRMEEQSNGGTIEWKND